MNNKSCTIADNIKSHSTITIDSMKTASAQASELEDDATDMKQTEYDFL